jgi:hypothetical protein
MNEDRLVASATASPWTPEVGEILRRLERIECALDALLREKPGREYYSTAEIAEILGKAEFTVREWCRLGRIRASKRRSGRGAHPAWVVAHEELQRFRREGLLPERRAERTPPG